MDNIELRREGANAVGRIQFVAPVQYSRSISTRSSDLVQVFYTILPSTAQVGVIDSERRFSGVGDIPSVIIRDENVDSTNLSSLRRRLVIRFGAPVQFRVRVGSGGRSIEVVLEGLGSSVRTPDAWGSARSPKPAPATATAAVGRYVVTLQSSPEASKPLPSSVPAAVQEFQVFTTRRVADGQTLYDTNLGYFDSQQEASAALELVIKRFPGAVVAELPSPASPTTARVQEGSVGESEATAAPNAQGSADVEASATMLLVTAQTAFDSGNYEAAIESLNQLLNLPPNSSSRRALELAGLSRLNAGDTTRAASEFELFLKLYPVGADSDRVRQLAAALPTMVPATAKTQPAVEAVSSTSGSVSTFYYGGKSDVRTQEFKDSPIGGLPILDTVSKLSAVDQEQWLTNIDLNWRYRDADKDMRLVFRDSYSVDLLPKGVNKQRLSAAYVDYRSFTNGTSFRLGRQSPNGLGVNYRFDGATVGYAFAPKWRVNAVAGVPTDTLLDTRRMVYGASVETEALTKEISGSVFVVQQVIDGQVDRRGVGTDLRYYSGGLALNSQFDYDVVLKGFNVAAFQGTWQVTDATVINTVIDHRAIPLFTLGNVLFFQDPALSAPARRIRDLLGTTAIETLREQVKGLTAYQSQARISGTTSVATNWQVGSDFSLTNVGEIKPVAVLLPTGQASTGNLWGVGAQLIGTNLYSARDTHVFNLNFLGGPTYRGRVLSYNNLSSLDEKWQLEPSLKYYTQNDTAGANNDAWTAGMRAVYRVRERVSLESELTYERSEATGAPTAAGPGNAISSARMNYYLGARYDF